MAKAKALNTNSPVKKSAPLTSAITGALRRGVSSFSINTVPALRERLSAFLGFSHGGSRDTYTVFGYPRELSTELLMAMYQRNAIANRIVKSYPQATWRDMPVLGDEQGSSWEEGDDFSEFALAAKDLFERHKVMRYIERADRLSGVGRYSLLVMGFQDGEADLSKPLISRNAPLLYLQPYAETSVTVQTWGTDPSDKMYGKPIIYNITQRSIIEGSSGRAPTKSFRVHHTRCIHISEFLEEDNVFGLARLAPIYNNLLDLEKVVGGSAETFWLCANRGIHFNVDPEMSLDEDGKQNIKDQADELSHSLRRYIVSQGIQATVLGAESPDPGPNAEKLLDLIAGGSGVPKRILIGSERGELASSQDENNWAQRIAERRTNFATTDILVPLINTLIFTGNLKPNGKWHAQWPDADTLGAEAEAQINLVRAQTMQTYLNSAGADMLIGPDRFCKEFLGTTSDVSEFPDPELDDDLTEDDEGNQVEDKDEGEEEEGATKPKDDKEKGDKPAVNAAPMSLYVSRKVLNAPNILKWAKEQGFKEADLVAADDMHVTVMYSSVKVDWMKIRPTWTEEESGNLLIPAGGPRVLSQFGDDAVVLEFRSNELEFRHADMKESGCVHGFAEYKPHITIAYGSGLPEGASPFQGPIVLGPEIFAEIKKDV